MILILDVPEVPKGSKTCVQCPHLRRIGGWCAIYKQDLESEAFARLPICLAGERVKEDWWVLVNSRGQECSPRESRERTKSRLRVTSGDRMVHGVCYRKVKS